jgi:predicted nucleotidyltransferase
MPTKKTLVKVIHGSHLYGLNTPTSDLDYYLVYEFPWKNYRPKKQIDQKIKDDEDITTASLERFSNLCIKGVPQSLETLFADSSKWIEHDDSWYDKSTYLKSEIKSHISVIMETYKRTAWNFFEKDNFKKNRHALRLCLNAIDLKKKGEFNPTLDLNAREEITRIAELPRRQREDVFKDIFFDAFGDI